MDAIPLASYLSRGKDLPCACLRGPEVLIEAWRVVAKRWLWMAASGCHGWGRIFVSLTGWVSGDYKMLN